MYEIIPDDQLTAEERAFAADQGEGVWRTVNGRRIFIKKGESVQDAFKRELDRDDKDQPRAKLEKGVSNALEGMGMKGAQVKVEQRGPGGKATWVTVSLPRSTSGLSNAKVDQVVKGVAEGVFGKKLRSGRSGEVVGDRYYYDWVAKNDEDSDTRVVELAHSNAIRGVEIFGTGTHNGDPYTEKDIDDMIEAFKELDYRPAVKVGHTKDQPGSPAYGWVKNLRKVGTKMVADLEDMHDSVVQAIKDKRYDRLSSEIYFNLKRGGKQFRRALKAVALLGAEVPAVAGLTPLHKMEFAEAGFDSVSFADQSLEVQQQALIDSLTERVAKLNQALTDQKEQDTMKIKELNEKKAQLEAQLAALRAKESQTDEEKAQIAKFSQDLIDLGKKIDTEIAELSQAAEEGKQLKSTVAALQAKDRAREVAERVSRCTVKAFHADLEGLYRHAVANPEVKVKHFAVDKDGKRSESEKTLTESLDSLVAALNASAAKLFTVVTNGNVAGREEGPSENPGAELHAKAQERLNDGKSKTYEEACDAVLAADPELKKRYHEQRPGVAA